MTLERQAREESRRPSNRSGTGWQTAELNGSSAGTKSAAGRERRGEVPEER